jgi:hypothetical protein
MNNTEWRIEKLTSPVHGYNYNAQLWTQTGGEAYYCGIGKYFVTEEAAKEYCSQN